MRAQEFITEKKAGRMTKRQDQSTRGVNIYGDGPGEQISGDYIAYRMGMAVAGANGKDPVDMKKSWIGKRKSAHPYTQEEQDMLNQAYKAVGAGVVDLNHGDMRSLELDSTNTISPVANWMKTK